MDHHHYRHHQQPRQLHHHHPQLVDSSSSSRYLPHLPPPPPPPPSFPDDRPPPFPPLPQRHLPPPPPLQHHHHHNHPLSPRILHHPPPPPTPPSHPHHNHNHNPIDNTFNFVNSPPHHHHNHQHQQQHQHQHQHHLQHRRVLEDDPRDGFRSSTRVIPSNRVHVYDNHHHHSHIEHNIEEVDRQPRFRVSELPPPPPLPASSRVSPLSPVARRSPPQFVQFDRVRREIDSPPRFREELGLESRVRVHHPDAIEYQLRRDRVDERRVLGVFDRLEGDFNRDRDRDFEHHERYYPEMMPARKEIEPNSGISESRRGSLNDEVLLRGGRDDVLEENVNMRRGSGSSNGGGSREVSRSPIKFRIGGVEVDDEGSNRGRKEEVQEYNNRGTPKKNVQKKSAFLRIQPGKQQHSSSNNIRNRLGNDKTPSPNKGKESNSEFLDHRVSEERVRNPVELDVSFKSNALVAKPIMAAPSCSGVDCNVNNSLNDLDVRIEGNSFPKVESLTNSSSVSKREEKGIKNRIRVSPIMKRLGDPNSVEVRGIRSESSSGRSSSVSGSITCKADRKGEVSGKLNKNAALDHVSSPTVRKKRKAISPLSCLSRSVSTKTDSGLVNEDCSASKPCDDSIPSGVSVKCLEKESSCGGNVIDSNQNISVDMGIIDVSKSSTGLVQEEVLGHPVSEASESERMGEIGMSEHFPGSQGSLKAGLSEVHVNMEGISPDEQKISNPDEDVTKPVEKCSLDIYIEKQSVKDQDMAPALVNNGSEEGSSELVIHVVDNRNSNDNCCGNVDTLDFVENMNSISIPANVSDKENIVDLSCSLVDADKSCENQVLSSPENATIGLSLGGLYSDKNYEPESRYSVNQEQIESFLMDVCNNKRTSLSNDDDVAIGLEHVRNSVSDVRDRNDIQEQQCQGSETKLVNDESTLGREDNPKTCLGAGGVLAFSVDKDSSLLNRKRKSKSEPESLDLRISESCHQAGSLSFSIENATLPVEKHSSAVSGSSCVESDVLHVNEFAGSCVKGMNSMNHPPALCPIEHSSSFGKKRKIYPLEPVFSDSPESKSSDLPLSAKSLTPVADEPSANHSPQFSEGFDLQKSVIIGKDVDVVDRAASNLCAETFSLAGNTISEFLCSDSCLSITENTPPDVEQLKLPDSGCLQKVDESLMTAVTNDGRGLIALGTNEGKDNLQCLPSDHTRDAEQESLAKNMDCDDAVAQNSNPSSLSACLQSCFDSPRDGVTANFDVLHTPSNLGLTESSSLFPSSLDTSISSPVFHVISGEKLDKDDKKPKQAFAKQNSNTSQANLLPESHKKSLKPGISATSGVQPSAQKGLSKSSKQGKTTISSSNVMIRQRRNVLTRPEASTSASHLSAVSKPSNKSQTFPVKPRTWHRSSNLTANIPVKKPSVGITPPQRALSGKAVKVQDTSYIRKGNSLVRNPITGVATSGSRVVGASNGQPRPNKTDKIRNIVSSVMTESTGLPDVLVTGGRSAPIEMPKTPPLPCSSKASDNDVVYSRECTSSLHVDHPDGKDNDEALNPDVALNSLGGSETAVNRASEDPGTLNDGDLLGSNYEKMIYIKHKSNQLIAALKTSQSPSLNIDNATATTSDVNYYKRRKNQLIRASSDGNIQQMASVNKDSSKSLSQRAFHASSGRSFTRRLSNKVKATKSSLVWKLDDSKSCGKGVDSLRSRRLLSHLLPWKRATYWSRKLLSSKKRGAVYVRSSRGFSLRRSKVISLPGTSLKWSKSMEKRSKKIGEEAAQAVAAMDSVQKSGSLGVSSKAESSLKMHPGERIFRIGVFRYRMDSSRRTLQRISDEDPSDFTASKTEKDPRKTYVPKRLLIGSDEYVRIGNGNQLVRDPKRRTRILASEKVRWSLHTARMRLAKKRKFCQFFTRFGKCNKGEGKCSFMHDPSKIAVCTKFLKGLCSDLNCKLTHKVIPERMPDCSFFLQGLCSNEKCPYRHVSVNPKASICESFLRGYCAEGNECRKKHSYICPEFEASGSCPQGSKCKLYHPKKGKTKKRKGQRDRKNAKGRYFGSDLSVIVDPETKPILLRNHAEPDEVSSVVVQGDLGDFVSLDVSDDETQEDGPTIEHTFLPQDGPLNSHLDNTDELIKPLRLLGRL